MLVFLTDCVCQTPKMCAFVHVRIYTRANSSEQKMRMRASAHNIYLSGDMIIEHSGPQINYI